VNTRSILRKSEKDELKYVRYKCVLVQMTDCSKTRQQHKTITYK